ncbi:MAG: hypothetical protein CMN30_26070 [Sandaracinus sp.]|nr:hypothetical protein [Sandaracinus sp.]|tara:strand:+ start:1399 stop:2376 length:978 start_codon:yes stop_codon:yes gene_type:complete
MKRDLVLLGGSAGAVSGLRTIVRALPADLPAAVLATVHLGADSPALLGEILDRETALRAANARDGDLIEHGRIYVAPPDFHMLVDGDHIRLYRGPRENRCRPAIDPLFRTAAASHGPRVLAGILTGWLDDGSAGLLDVKSCGGGTFVQDPDDAQAPDMPTNAMALVEPDDVVPLADIAGLIARRVAADSIPSDWSVPESVRLEAQATFDRGNDYGLLDREGKLSGVSCPDCGGPMWEMGRGGQFRVRCHTGHVHGEQSLIAAQRSEVERALGVALRVLEERARMGDVPPSGRTHPVWRRWPRSGRRGRRRKPIRCGASSWATVAS